LAFVVTALVAVCLSVVSAADAAAVEVIERLSTNELGLRVPGSSYGPYISGSGEVIAFSSDADLTGSGATTQGAYVRDGSTGRISRIADGTAIGLSSDGRYLAVADADRSGYHVYDLSAGSSVAIALPGGILGNMTLVYGASLSANGRFFVYGAVTPDPGNPYGGHIHIFVDDLTTQTQTQVPNPSEASWEWPTISNDGRFLAFNTDGRAKVIDLSTGAIVFDPGYGLGFDWLPKISPDGTQVLFAADASRNGEPVTHVYVGSIATGLVKDLTPSESAFALADGSWDATSRYVSFSASASLLPSDINEKPDVYVYDTRSQSLTLASTDASGTQGNKGSGRYNYLQGGGFASSALAGNAKSVVFQSFATNLVSDDGTGVSEIEGVDPTHRFPLYRTDIYESFLDSVEKDTQPPSVSCTSVDTLWHADNVSAGCMAADSGSGLEYLSQASFSLSTDVPVGQETTNANTEGREVCDIVGNCTEAGPIGPFKIDRKPPTISISQPEEGQVISQGADAIANYSCADDGAGVASCEGSALSGYALDTSTQGQHTFTVTATDAVGNEVSRNVNYTVSGPPEFGRCVKVPSEKIGSKTIYHGGFTAATCLKTSVSHGGQYEWEPGVLQRHFTTEIKESTKATLETVKGSKVNCTGETSAGEYTGMKTVGNVVLAFTGCELAQGKAKCASPGAAAGEVVSVPLEGMLGMETLGTTSASNKIGLDLYPAGKKGPLVVFDCASTTVLVQGSIIVPLTENKMLTVVTLKATTSKGIQKPESFVEEPVDVLEESFNGSNAEQAGLKITTVLTTEEAVEVNTVF
jgi:hypothetical protein